MSLSSIADIPLEILAHIFEVGTILGWEEKDENPREKPSSDFHDTEFNLAMQQELDRRIREVTIGLDDDERTRSTHNRFPVTVSHVCRYWREIALSIPLLWTHHRITWLSNPCCVEEWLRRSKLSPLDIEFDIEDPDDFNDEQYGLIDSYLLRDGGLEEFLEEHDRIEDDDCEEFAQCFLSLLSSFKHLLSEFDRWKRFSITSNHNYVLPAILVNLAPFAPTKEPLALEEISLRLTKQDNDNFDFDEEDIRLRVSALFNPCLAGLRSFSTYTAPFPYKAMNGASLVNLDFSYLVDNGPQASRRDVLNILCMAHFLQTLHMSNFLFLEEDPIDHPGLSYVCYLPHLHTLKLAGLSEHDAGSVLKALHAPHISILHLTWKMESYESIMQLLVRPLVPPNYDNGLQSGCPWDVCKSYADASAVETSLVAGVRELKLGGFECGDLQDLYRAAPHLEKLCLKRFGTLEPSCSVLSRPWSGEGGQVGRKRPKGPVHLSDVPCPALKELVVCHLRNDGAKLLLRFTKGRRAMNVPINALRLDREMKREEFVKEAKWKSLKELVGEIEWVSPIVDNDDWRNEDNGMFDSDDFIEE